MRSLLSTGRRRGESRIVPYLNALAGESLDPLEKRLILPGHKRDRITVGSRPARPPDPVNIVFRLMGNVKVYDMRDPADVQTAGGNVCGDKDSDAAILKCLQRALALALRAIGMDRRGRDALPVQPPGNLVGTVFCAREYQHALHLLGFDGMQQERRFGLLADAVEMLFDGLDRTAAFPDFHGFRIPQDFSCKCADLVGHRGGKEHRLPACGHLGYDLPYVFDKSHVQHTICLIQDKHLDRLQTDGAPLEVIQKASRRRDGNVQAAPEDLELLLHVDTAVNCRGTQVDKLAICVHRSVHLLRELARGRQHEGPGVLMSLFPCRNGCESVQDRQDESSRLARARLCQPDNVPSFKCRTYCQ